MAAVCRQGIGTCEALIGGLVVPVVEKYRYQAQCIDFCSRRSAGALLDRFQLVKSPSSRVADLDGCALEVALDADVLEISIFRKVDAPVEIARDAKELPQRA